MRDHPQGLGKLLTIAAAATCVVGLVQLDPAEAQNVGRDRGGAREAAVEPIVLTARDGLPGGTVGRDHGADQGEDQGENVAQMSKGALDLGPITVRANNNVHTDTAVGGAGGDVHITYENTVYTRCNGSVPGPFDLALQPVEAWAGAGGAGGAAGSSHRDSLSGQASDQGEDQGENIGQFVHGARPRDVSVSATNHAFSGLAAGGHGGAVKVLFDNRTVCGQAPAGSDDPPDPQVTTDGAGNISATYHDYADCATGLGLDATPLVVHAGNGGAGGSTGQGQGADQGEDQGENIGQWATGGNTEGGILVEAPHNHLQSGGAPGQAGADVNVTFVNVINCQAADASSPPALGTVPVVAHGGVGGAGGTSGRGVAADQGEDQGENIGQFAFGRSRFGTVTVDAHNTSLAGRAPGGAGGAVNLVYRDHAACGVENVVSIDERTTAHGGHGGRGGSSGRDQGSDMAEDQGENIAQFATGRAKFGDITVSSVNRLESGDVLGGHGGAVHVAYHPDACPASLPPVTSLDQRVHAQAGPGGHGGATGRGQGADQTEDQGENIGQFASGHVRLGDITVVAHNTLIAGNADGGAGGDVVALTTAPDCTNPPCSVDAKQQVNGSAGSGGAGGSSGRDQGSDQSEDQGENILHSASSGVTAGQVHVIPDNTTSAGTALGGPGGNVITDVARTSGSCVGAARFASLQVRAAPGRGGVAGSHGVLRTRGTGGATYACSRPAPTRAPARVFEHPRDQRTPTTRGSGPSGYPARKCAGRFGSTTVNLVVPRGATCKVSANAQIVHDLLVLPGGTLIFGGGEVGHDLTVVKARGVSIRGGSVGHRLSVVRLAGHRVPDGNRICGIQVESDIAVQEARRTAKHITVGGRNCAGNHSGHDIVVEKNALRVAVRKNHAMHSIYCHANRHVSAGDNHAARSNRCASS